MRIAAVLPGAVLATAACSYQARSIDNVPILAGDAATASGDGTMGDRGNLPPIVALSHDDVVLEGAPVTVTAFVTDPEGDGLTLDWLQVAGTPVGLVSTGMGVDFTAPSTSGDVISIRLLACDSTSCTLAVVTLVVVDDIGTAVGFVAKPPRGSDATGDGSASAPWETISHGLNTLSARIGISATRGWLFVAEGTYAEAVAIDADVSLYGSYDETLWIRDYATHPTVVSADPGPALNFPLGSTATSKTEVDGFEFVAGSGGIPTGDLHTVTALHSEANISNSLIQIPDAPEDATGIVMVSSGPARLDLVDVQLVGGSTAATGGAVIGIQIDSAAVACELLATRLDIQFGATATRNVHYGLLTGGTCVASLSDSTIITPPAATTPTLPADDESIGIVHSGGSLTVTRSLIDPGAAYAKMAGIAANGAGSIITVVDSLILAGNLNLPMGGTGTATALILRGGANADVGAGSRLVGGADLSGAGISRQIGALVEDGAHLTITDSFVEGGTGIDGIGLWVKQPATATLANTTVNGVLGAPTCNGAQNCYGILLEGVTSASNIFPTPAPSNSCCDPTTHDVIIEDSVILGGTASNAAAVAVLDDTSPDGPGVCINASRLDGGDCDDAVGSTCYGLHIQDAGYITVHNSEIYGGTGHETTGIEVSSATGQVDIANNFIHGGDEPATVGSSSVGLVFEVSGRGARVLYNSIYSGDGSTEATPVKELGVGADPDAFAYNNLYGGGSILYFNFDDTTGTGLTSATEMALMSSGQRTAFAPGNVSAPSCYVSNDIRSGPLQFIMGSMCRDHGSFWTGAGPCEVCIQPWVDHSGNFRLPNVLLGAGATCTTGATLNNNGDPDIGPLEEPP